MRFLEAVAEEYREAARNLVIGDNLNIHHDGRDERWSHFNARHDRKFEFVYTPLHASWGTRRRSSYRGINGRSA